MALFWGKIEPPAEGADLTAVRRYLEARINRSWAYRLILEAVLGLTLLAVVALTTSMNTHLLNLASAIDTQTRLLGLQQEQIKILRGDRSQAGDVRQEMQRKLDALADTLRQGADKLR